MTENPFIGTWRLISYEFRSTNGLVIHPFGLDAYGYISYSQNGYMSVSFMPTGRPPFNTGDLHGGSLAEKGLAYETYFSYCGKYDFNDAKVIHHIEVSLFPNWTGKDQARFYKFEGDRLILESPPLLVGGIEQVAHLVWQKC